MYGIGRIPQDRDLTQEALARPEAERIQPTPKPKNRLLRCRKCGQTGEAGRYPFSTNPSSGICDDCY